VYIKDEKEFKSYIKYDTSKKITIIDSGGFDSALNRLAIFYSDFIITPVSDRFNEISGLMKYGEIINELEELTGEKIKINILLNNINPHIKNFEGLKNFIKKNKKFKLFKNILRQRVDYDKAAWMGKSVIEYNKNSKASKEFENFIKELEKRIKIKNG
jgi:chromosome partitioning protein